MAESWLPDESTTSARVDDAGHRLGEELDGAGAGSARS
jgi:hypothetical protein